MGMSRRMMVMAAAGCFLFSTVRAQDQKSPEQQMKEYLEILRKDVRTQKQSVVDQAMGLEAGDKAKFWAVYEKYQEEVKLLWDQRFANIKKYSDNYPKMNDAVADEIAMKAMDIDAQRSKIRNTYYGKIKAVLGARVAARFWQTEAMLDHMVDLQMGTEIPLIP